MKIRLIESPLIIPRYRQVRLPTVAAEFSPYAEVEINDPNIEKLDLSPVDIVGITAQVYNSKRAIYISEKFREMGAKTILGGPFGLIGEKALEHFDAVVVGELEGLGERIVSDFEKNELQGVYRLESPPENWGLKVPRRDLQKANRYYWFNYPMEFSRGCPHACSFCYGPYAFGSYRTRALDALAEDLENWDHGLIEAVDMHFAADKKYLLEVCRLLEEHKAFGWFGEATLHSLDDEEVLRALERSNCVAVFVGMESIDSGSLKSVNKSFNKVDQYQRIIERIQSHGIYVHAGLIWGLDGQNKSTFDQTAEFAEKLGLYLTSANLAAYYPGTKIYEDLLDEGRILVDDYQKINSSHVMVEPDQLSVEDIYEGAKRFNKKFYSYRSIFKRSFQTPNFNLARVVDYWGFNLIYRSYFNGAWRKWLGLTISPWPVSKDEKKTFPLSGGRLSPIYWLLDKEWIIFHHLYQLWEKPAVKASAVVTLIFGATLLAAGVGLSLLFKINGQSRWPAIYPDKFTVIFAFIAFCISFIWLTARIANTAQSGRAPPRVTDKESDAPSRQNAAIQQAMLVMAAAPGFLIIFSTPFGSRLLSAFLSATILLGYLKGVSVVASDRSINKNIFRVGSFMLFHPTLEYDTAFKLYGRKRPWSVHYALMIKGAAKFWLGAILFIGLFYLLLRDFDSTGGGIPAALARLVVFFLLFSGGMEYLAGYWRMVGLDIKAPFGRFDRSLGGVSDIWRRWNVYLHRWLFKYIYKPLGGNKRPLISTLSVFLFSGAFFAGVLYPATGKPALLAPLFFLINAAPVAFEKVMMPDQTEIGFKRRLMLIAGTVILVLSLQLFFRPFDMVFL